MLSLCLYFDLYGSNIHTFDGKWKHPGSRFEHVSPEKKYEVDGAVNQVPSHYMMKPISQRYQIRVFKNGSFLASFFFIFVFSTVNSISL